MNAKTGIKDNKILFEQLEKVEEFEYALQWTRWLLEPTGIWPLKSLDYSTIIVRRIVNIISLISLVCLTLPAVLHIIFVEKDNLIRLVLVGPVSFQLICLSKYIILSFKIPKLNLCFIEMALDWGEAVLHDKEKGIMMRNSRNARILTIIFFVLMFGSGISYNFILPFVTPKWTVNNVTQKTLPYPSYYFDLCNPNVSPLYDLIFSYQCIVNFLIFNVTIGLGSLSSLCAFHISSRFTIISLMFKKLVDDFSSDFLGTIVRKHLRSLRLASKMEDILNEVALVEIVGSSINLCLLGYYFLNNLKNSDIIRFLTYVGLFLTLTFNIFLFCYVGEILTEQCEALGTIIYSVDWYKLSPKQAQSLTIIVSLTQRPVVITAGKMIILSIRSFSNVIKAAATYFNMLRTLTVND